MTSAVPATHRFDTRRLPCPGCGGGADLPLGHGVRCYGFRHDDPNWFTCTRLPSPYASAGGWTHVGRRCGCACGRAHDTTPVRQGGFAEATSAPASRAEVARGVWGKTEPIDGTPAKRYLRSRGITIDAPLTLRFAYLQHARSGTRYPTLVAAVLDAGGDLRAVHRTYLAPDGEAKAAVTPARMMLGPAGGCAVHLAAAADCVAVAEGIETALSVMQATGTATWAALSASGIQLLELPALPVAAEVVIAADADRAGTTSATAAEIPGARLVTVPGDAPVIWAGDHRNASAQAILQFVAPGDPVVADVPAPLAAVQTILFTDLVGSTEMQSRLGDDGARHVARRHDDAVRHAMAELGGREIKHTGDGIMASFTSPADAVSCALRVRDEFERYNATNPSEALLVRFGLNAGEPISEDGDLFGLSVTIAARIANWGGPGQVFATDVVRQLLLGKGFSFVEAGRPALQGVDGLTPVFEVGLTAG